MADPAELEKLQVKGAIRTDFILSAEIMAIALASLGPLSLWTTAAALIAVGAGDHRRRLRSRRADREARRHRPAHGRAPQPRARAPFGDGLVHVVPQAAHGAVRASARRRCCGSAAGSCSTASRSCTSSKACRTSLHDWSVAIGHSLGVIGPAAEWLVYALGVGRRRPDHRRDHRRRSSASSPSTRKS